MECAEVEFLLGQSTAVQCSTIVSMQFRKAACNVGHQSIVTVSTESYERFEWPYTASGSWVLEQCPVK